MCDGNGACADNGFADAGTICNNDDQCDGGGVCVDCTNLDGCSDYADDGNACTSVVCENTLCIDVNDDDNACDLGYACTVDHCVAGVCEIESISGCLIDDTCFAEGDSQDDDGCVACDPASSNIAWTNMDGAACAVSDDGNACTDAVCRDGFCAFEGNTSYTCDDGDPCTYDDACAADGLCGGLAYSCNDHGTCGGDNTCSCAEGYSGAYCDACAEDYQDNDGDGICEIACSHPDMDCGHAACDDSGGTAACLCSMAPSMVGNFGGVAYKIQVVGSYAYVALGYGGLYIFDVSSPNEPVLTGQYNTPVLAANLFVQGGLAFIADLDGGLLIIDVSNPSNPVLAGTYDTPSFAHDVFVENDLAYVANWASGLQIIDVSDPANPVLAGSLDTPDRANSVFVKSGLAYVGGNGLQILNVSDPAHPELVGSYDTTRDPQKILVDGNLAYVASGMSLLILNVSDPANPVFAGSIDTPDDIWDIFTKDGLAYLADFMGGLQIVDVSDPYNPVFVFSGSYNMMGDVMGVFVQDGSAFVANGTRGLRIIDVALPANPELAGSYNTLGNAYGVFVHDGLAYVADCSNGLQVLDISDSTNPMLAGSCDTPGCAHDVFVENGLAYVTDYEKGLHIVDVSDPTNPVLVGSYDTPGYASGVFATGGLVYVADGSSGLHIVDASDPHNPTLAGSFNTSGTAYDVFIQGDMAYIADGDSGLKIVDVSDALNPIFAGSYNTPGKALDVWGTSGVAYVADNDGGLQIIDVSDPANPRLAGSYHATDRAIGVYVKGSLMYIAAATGGLEILDISDPVNPVLTDSYATPSIAGYVFAEGGMVYMMSAHAGLQIIQVADCTCAEGYAGALCDECAEGYTGYPECQANIIPGFVPITAGTFWMGSPDGCPGPTGYPGDCSAELGRVTNETLHYVELTFDFEMSRYELTEAEFEQVMGWDPVNAYDSDCTYGCGNSHPVKFISWFDSLAYANELSLNAGFSACYVISDIICEDGTSVGTNTLSCMNTTQGGIESATVTLAPGISTPQECEGYRLPTEAEWEYTIRAGDQYTAFYQSEGNDGTITYTDTDPNMDQIGWYGWFIHNIGSEGTRPAGGKEENAWGLSDMSGNVFEWTWDWYQAAYQNDVGIDPTGPATGQDHVLRGGTWNHNAQSCRTARRYGGSPGLRNNDMGVRVCRTLPNPCSPDPCIGRGACNPVNGTCTCNEGYAGALCDECAEGYTGYPDCVPAGNQ